MKCLIFSLLALIALFSLVLTNSFVIGRLIDKTRLRLEKIDPFSSTVLEEITECYREFEAREKYISLTVSHSDLTDINTAFAEMIGAARADVREEIVILKSRLLNSLEHLRRLSGFNIDSILFINVKL